MNNRVTRAASGSIHVQNVEAAGACNTRAGVLGADVRSRIHGGSQVFQGTHAPSRACSTDAPYPDPPSDPVELQRDP